MNTKYNKIFYPVALLAAVITSCTNNEVDTLNMPEGAVTFLAEMTTRATDTAFEANDAISVTAYTSDGAIYESNVEYSYVNDIFTSDSAIAYSSSTQELSFRAIYPYVEMADDKSVSFSVAIDQSEGTNYTLSDLMSSYVSSTSSATPTLVFDHLMSKIIINLTSDGVEMVDVLVNLNAVADVNYNLSTLSSEVSGSATAITMCGNGVNSYKAILAPQSIAANTTFGTISVGGVDYDISLVAALSLKGGSQYTIDATLTEDGGIIFDSPMINDWDERALDEDFIEGAAYFTLADFEGMTILPDESIWVITDESATSTSDSDFGDYTALHTVLDLAESAERKIELIFPNLTELSKYALYNCTSLTSIELPVATTIGEGAFNRCISLTSVELPAATTIGEGAFGSCTSLTSIELPAATTIGNSAFYNCASLTSVELPVATTIGEYAFGYCSSLTSVELPAATTTGNYAFRSCTSLTSVELPAATTVGNYAFRSCTSLTSISLPVATTIGKYAFYDCTSLTLVELPAATTTGNYAFYYCTSLSTLYLASDSGVELASLGSNLFHSMPTLYTSSANEKYIGSDNATLTVGDYSYTFPAIYVDGVLKQ